MNHNNHYGIAQKPSRIQASLDRIDAFKAQIDKQKTGQKHRWAAIQEKLRVDWTYDSNAIEGSSLTRGETLFFLQEGLTVEGKPFKDFLDARNHAEAIDWLYDIIKQDRSITPGLVKEINALLLSGVRYTPAIDETGRKIQKPAHPGQYKILPNHVLQADGTIHFYTDPIHVTDEMETLCQWINDRIEQSHPLVVGAIAHYNMVRIHPFDNTPRPLLPRLMERPRPGPGLPSKLPSGLYFGGCGPKHAGNPEGFVCGKTAPRLLFGHPVPGCAGRGTGICLLAASMPLTIPPTRIWDKQGFILK